MTDAQCRSCRASIVWLRTENGKSMPVDASDALTDAMARWPHATFETLRRAIDVVSHFATCPNAATHRRTR